MNRIDIKQVAYDLLLCAMAHNANAQLIGGITARELAALAASARDKCPNCGRADFIVQADGWSDCNICLNTVILMKDAVK